MKVKKFLANDNHEAMLKVKTELGPDAVILHQRKVKPKGFFGLFKKPLVEIVAAREEISTNSENKDKNVEASVEDKLKRKIDSKATSINVKENKDDLNKEITEIKGMLQAVLCGINNKQVPNIPSGTNESLTQFYNYLITQEINEELLYKIVDQFNDLIKDNNLGEVDKSIVYSKFDELIRGLVTDQGHMIDSKVIFFVGPTGVGKTTTIAKLAANFSINEGKTVGLISADTYRIAAVEQLKTYCNILNVPMEVIYESSEVNDAIKKLRDKDIILIDTAGRSHKNVQQVEELKHLINEVQEKEIYLVMSCTTNNKDLKEIIKSYEFLEDYKIIFTKLDEATTVGQILNVAYETKKPISYITTGQSVPDDIEILDINKVSSLLLKEAEL